MRGTGKVNRPTKRDAIAINDEESIRDQPAVKKREEEPVPSSEVAELQRRVRKLEKKLKRSSQATVEAESRAELAEKKLADVTAEVKIARRRADSSNKAYR
ncbi:hypothetical protein PENTCL1PPCAC_18 [Pristionchus entomophagus]|uniref:Uncharacterized protein n=1 Tax=Pristionchus entomophagus TaxID=358040 RepID=A0AAV5S7T5_9BILA|nr:hypothetical protein PENTCL1PPCAC_18 [Pristionchus entomophagus]